MVRTRPARLARRLLVAAIAVLTTGVAVPITAMTSTAPPAAAVPVWPSDDCEAVAHTNLLTGYFGLTYVKTKTAQVGPNSTAVCVAFQDGAFHAGGKLVVDGSVPGVPVGVALSAAAAASCATKPGNQRINSGTILGEPWWLDVAQNPVAGDAAWVCVQFGDFAVRVTVADGSGLGGVTWHPDSETAHPVYASYPWPVTGQPSGVCMAQTSGKTRWFNVMVGGSPFALFTWQQDSEARTHVCVRAGGPGGWGGRFIVDAGAALSTVVPVGDTNPCPFDVFTSTSPAFGVHTSYPEAVPVAACVSIGSLAVGVKVDPLAPGAIASFIPDSV